MASYDGRDLNLHIPMKCQMLLPYVYDTEDAARGIIIIDTVQTLIQILVIVKRMLM
jgi:hypothetical protein